MMMMMIVILNCSEISTSDSLYNCLRGNGQDGPRRRVEGRPLQETATTTTSRVIPNVQNPGVNSGESEPVPVISDDQIRSACGTRPVVRGPGNLCFVYPRKRGRRSLFEELVCYDPEKYKKWATQFYCCSYSRVLTRQMLERFTLPDSKNVLNLPLVPTVPIDLIDCDELFAMRRVIGEWPEDKPIPVISIELLSMFLGYVHQFTFLGLEAQATGFSLGPDGVISCLALFPPDKRSGVCTQQEL